jgi:hypothetical protein
VRRWKEGIAHPQWLDGTLPQPAEDTGGTVLPVGRNAPTFTGGSFDLQEVSLQVVRGALAVTIPDVFDAGDWDVVVLSHFKDGGRVLTTWEVGHARPQGVCCNREVA